MCEAPASELGHRKNEPAAAMADVLRWKDFPKGLRVLLHESCSSSSSSSHIKSKLEQMEYSVSLFVDEKEALEAVARKAASFHVAILEITAANSEGCFRFLETAKGLPTIMISDAECIETMIKCIALGAAEFLRKPVSEEKLKNIWQLVVHKAFNAGGAAISNSLKPIKETVSSMLHLNHDDDHDDDGSSTGADRFPAPTTPQLERFGRSSLSDPSKICCSATKSVDETCNNSSAGEDEDLEKEIIESHDPLQVNAPLRRSKKRSKVDWTPELHRRFVQAVDQLGIDQAIPSKILELMRVEGLTRHNVASHLQKYRMRRKHVLPKDEGVRMSWQRHGNLPPMMAGAARSCNYRPISPFTTTATTAAGYPVWGHPHAAAVQSWPALATFPPWHPSVDHHWPWKSNAKMHADAWGCPVVPRGHYPAAPIPPHYSAPAQCGDHKIDGGLTEEMIDEVVREALTEPWRPLPLGLKPPSTESVLSELYRQGISKVPP